MKLRREYTKEFKRDAISLVIDQGYSQSDAAKSLGVHAALLSRWVREYKEDEGNAFRGKGKLRGEEAEIRELREEIKRLKMEKEILKKAAADSTDHCNT
jgi:transposase